MNRKVRFCPTTVSDDIGQIFLVRMSFLSWRDVTVWERIFSLSEVALVSALTKFSRNSSLLKVRKTW
jgi:hypothetical protein